MVRRRFTGSPSGLERAFRVLRRDVKSVNTYAGFRWFRIFARVRESLVRRALSARGIKTFMRTERLPTLEDVAAVAGVSRATVSRVINGIRNVDPAIQETVQAAIAATGYVPNHAARTLVTRRTGSVALVVSEAEHRRFDDPFLGRVFTDPFFGRVVSGILEVLRPRGVNLILMLTESAE